MAFERGGFRYPIDVAQTGVEALAYLQIDAAAEAPRSPLPTLILLDIQLPGIDGLEVLSHIRNHARTRLIPVVVLTTSSEQQDLLRSYELGCNSYIQKPVNYGSFLDVVQQLGLYWLVQNLHPLLQ